MEAVEYETEMRVVGTFHDSKTFVERDDTCAPGERFVADLQAVLPGAFGKLEKLAGGAFLAVGDVRFRVGARQQERRAGIRHGVERGFRAVEVPLQLLPRDAFKIALGPLELDTQAEIFGMPPDM